MIRLLSVEDHAALRDAMSTRLSATGRVTVYSFAYNGAGDRLKQIIAGTLTTYALDFNPSAGQAAGLTQVLADGGNRYVYGNSRVAQYAGATASFFLADGLGSVRQPE